ncbi:efflux RND transporter periplasmic adaptor subunit [Variovorax sp. J22P168]|uniref:efflux RND transporter periplasmic adaptor subunit n=1 Tax=Variovorax jilinensis TaxID=3053513 RepID=UPI0025759EF1|nr:efflux RND transporter periplasmic adaptor subunit [Variovorax sp. J22P168]MDM0011875.1 efflux RND transporter periplasmic adaptor subunit [Variovorax sp. J22P168]
MSSPYPEPLAEESPAPRRPPSRRRRWLGSLLALIVVLALAGAAWYVVKRSNEPAAGRGPGGPGGGFGGASSTVGHAAARRMDLPILIDALGTVTPLATVTLKPQVGGVLTEVLYTEGQTVSKGQLLARIDPRPYEQALMQAQGNRARDEAQLEAARVTLSRYRTLLGQDSIARQDVDTQSALVKQLEGTVLTDRAAEAAARLNLDYTRVTSPVAGRIGLRTVDPGNIVTANAATGIAVITQMNPIDVQFAVPQDRVPDIQAQLAKGAPLAVKALDRVRSAVLDTGTFSTLDNVVDTSTGTVRAKARFNNVGTPLFPNQFVNVQMVLRTVDAIVVPVTAVRTGPSGNFVYVVNEDRTVSMRPVKRGEATVDVVAIVDGLKDGELVVTEGGDRLKDGARVLLQGDKPSAAPRQRTPGARGPGGPGAPGAAGAPGSQGAPNGEGRRQRPPPQ